MRPVDFSPSLVGAPQTALADAVSVPVLWAVIHNSVGMSTSKKPSCPLEEKTTVGLSSRGQQVSA